MHWTVGIDEAGYGPNLGPFVMTAVACTLPEEAAGTDLWSRLGPTVRRGQPAAPGKAGRAEGLYVDDSKVVYSSGAGLGELERGVLALLRDGALAGGFLETAKPQSVILIRQGPGPSYAGVRVDLKNLEERSDMGYGPLLEPRDIVFVPKTRIARVDKWIDQYVRKVLPFTFRTYRLELGYENIWLNDAVAYTAALQPELFEIELSAGDVELSGELTTGATVFDRRRNREWRTNIAVATSVNVAAVRQQVLAGLDAAGSASRDD